MKNDDDMLVLPGETIDGEFSDVSGLQNDIDAELDQIFSEFGGSDDDVRLEIRVYRTQPGKGKLAYVFACLPHELPILDRLRDDYKGGDFEVRVLKNGKIFRRLKVSIEPPPANLPVKNDSGTGDLARAMMEGFNRLGELIAKKNEQPEIDPLTMQTQVIQNMVAMKELFGGGEQRNPVKELSELITLQKKLGLDVGEKDKEPRGLYDVLAAVAENVLPVLGEASRTEISAAKARAQNPVKNIEKHEEKKDVNIKMKMQLGYLCKMAEKDRDPETYAQLVVDNTPDEQIRNLYERAMGGKYIEDLAEINPDVIKHKKWFLDLGDLVAEICAEMLGLTGDGNETIKPVIDAGDESSASDTTAEKAD